jgi:hypothetical protein
VLEALLEVAADVLREIPIRRRTIQERLVAAAERLRRQHGVQHRAFCQRLGLSERTLRYWKQRARRSPSVPHPPPAPAPPSPPRDSRRGRFRLEVTLPGVQTLADTTQLVLFGVKLRLIALQDPGERYQRLLQTARVELEESAARVASAVTEALEQPGGIQLLTDQGTPYMAEEATAAYDALDLEHCPQNEGAPTDKATIERAFGTLKGALSGLLDLSNRLAARIPQLAQPELARSLAQVLTDALLQVYHDSRAELLHPLVGVDPEELADLIDDQRQRAHAEWRSKRLLLTHIFQSYQMTGSLPRFIAAHRRHALEDIQEAERRLRQRACRCIARACDRYFGGILNRVAEESRHRRSRQRAERQRDRQSKRTTAEIEALDRQRRSDPKSWLAQAFDLLLGSWLPDKRQLLFGGAGAGLAAARGAMRALADQLPYTWQDEIAAIWHSWSSQHPDLDPKALQAIRQVIDKLVEAELRERTNAYTPPASAILSSANNNPHPPHSPPLRI